MSSTNKSKNIDRKVNVFNRQRKIPVETGSLRDFLSQLTRRVAPNALFSVVLVSDGAMARYNSKFRGCTHPTDVLAFPLFPEHWEPENAYLGDILISVESAVRQSKARDGTLQDELKLLSLHGLLHLLGYNHESDRNEMESLEKELRKEFRIH